MGLGKTYVGSEKAISLGKNILVICQKSKVQDWYMHFYGNYRWIVYDLTLQKDIELFIQNQSWGCLVGIINYELAWRRPELSKLTDFTLMLDESSLIQNETTKQAKFILNKLHPVNVILLKRTSRN